MVDLDISALQIELEGLYAEKRSLEDEIYWINNRIEEIENQLGHA